MNRWLQYVAIKETWSILLLPATLPFAENFITKIVIHIYNMIGYVERLNALHW